MTQKAPLLERPLRRFERFPALVEKHQQAQAAIPYNEQKLNDLRKESYVRNKR